MPSRVQRCHCVSQRCDALEHEHVCVMCFFFAVPVAEDGSLGRALRSNVNIVSNQVSVFSQVTLTHSFPELAAIGDERERRHTHRSGRTASSSKEDKSNRSVDVALLRSSIVEQSLCTLMERRQFRRSLVHSACVLSSRCRHTAGKSAARSGVWQCRLWLALNQSLCRSPCLSFPCVPACVLLHLLFRRCVLGSREVFLRVVETQPTTTGKRTTRDLNCFASCCTAHSTSASMSCGWC